MLVTEGDPPPDCSWQEEERSFLASSHRGISRTCCCAVVPGVLVCVQMYKLYMCVYIRVCMYVYKHVYMYIYACVYVPVHTCVYGCVCIFVHRLWVSVAVRQRVGQCYGCTCVSVCTCMRMHTCVCIYTYAFFCRESCVHFGTGVLSTSACVGVYVI